LLNDDMLMKDDNLLLNEDNIFDHP
jgi:hypothetical protein